MLTQPVWIPSPSISKHLKRWSRCRRWPSNCCRCLAQQQLRNVRKKHRRPLLSRKRHTRPRLSISRHRNQLRKRHPSPARKRLKGTNLSLSCPRQSSKPCRLTRSEERRVGKECEARGAPQRHEQSANDVNGNS